MYYLSVFRAKLQPWRVRKRSISEIGGTQSNAKPAILRSNRS